MELVDKLNNKRQSLNKTAERQEKVDGEYRQSVHTWIMNSKGEFLIQKRSSNKKNFPNMWSQTGGAVDAGETTLQAALRECKEELNIDLQDQNQVENYGIKYICLPSDKVHTYILFAKGKLKMTKEQMSKYYEEYLKYLKENNLEIEFGKIHFIKKGKTTEELEKIKNPKRNYIVDLLEIDSNDEN